MNSARITTLLCCMQLNVAACMDVLPGDSVLLKCNHSTDGVIRVNWYYDFDGALQAVAYWGTQNGHEDYRQWEGRTEIISAVGDITINNLEVQDDGSYTCFGHDSQSSIRGSTYTLNVIGKPIKKGVIAMNYMLCAISTKAAFLY